MNFGKLFLIMLGSFLSLLLTFSSLAAEELESLEAIWNSAGIQQTAGKNSAKKVVPNKQAAINNAQRQKLAAAQRKQQQQQALQRKRQQQAQAVARNNAQKLADEKLARQRKIWKAKWDAEQLAKKQKIARANQQKQARIAASQKQQKSQAVKTVVHKKAPPKPLTREQYHLRWKQEQLRKQQLANKNNAAAKHKLAQHNASKKIPSRKSASVLPRSLPKKTHAAFRATDQKAIINALPYVVRTKLNKAKLNTYGLSAYVKAVNSPRPLLGHQEQTSRVPASVMKLITSYAALGTLGPNYRWPLDIMTNGVVRNGTLQGDLIVKGYGSPEFNKAELRKVLQGIKRKGIRNVSGRVVFDNSYFNVKDRPSFDGKSQSAYNAQPDALLYNERISSFQVRARGKRVNVSTTTPTHNLKIVNRMRKTKRGCRPRIAVSNRGAQTVVTFSGRFSSRCGTRTYSRVISRPSEMIYGAMKSMWKREVGGQLKTQFAMGRAPANARPLLRTHSRTLAEILPTIDKDSNNVMARQVMLTIGARVKGQGTQQAGANAIGAWLVSRGLNFPELRIENGSGLSRHARISARHVGDLLIDAYRSPFRNIFMQSLAIAGVDGTMKRRLKGSKVRGRGFFKTGTLRDVRSIAGYVKAADGKTYVMAILHNDPKARSRGLAAHDKLIEWVYSGGREQVASLDR